MRSEIMNDKVKKILQKVQCYQKNMEFVKDAAYSLYAVRVNFHKNERLKKRIDEALENLQEITCILANEFSKTNFEND